MTIKGLSFSEAVSGLALLGGIAALFMSMGSRTAVLEARLAKEQHRVDQAIELASVRLTGERVKLEGRVLATQQAISEDLQRLVTVVDELREQVVRLRIAEQRRAAARSPDRPSNR